MTSQHNTNIHLFSEADNVRIVQCSKEKGIKLTKKAWDKLVSVASTVDQYAINQKEGKWFLDANWYIHTKIIPKLIEPIRIYIGRWYLYNHKHLPKKEGMILNKRTWKQLKEHMDSQSCESPSGDDPVDIIHEESSDQPEIKKKRK